MRKHSLLPMIGAMIFFGGLFPSCLKQSQPVAPEKQNPVNTVKATIDSVEITFLGAHAMWNRMPGSDLLAGIGLILLVRNKAIEGTLNGAIVGPATVYNSAGDTALFTYAFEYVCGTDAADWKGQMKPGQKDSIWCMYHFNPGTVPLDCDDTIFVRFGLTDPNGNLRYVDSPRMRYECVW